MPRMKTDVFVLQLDHLVSEHPDFEVLHEPSINGYCFRCVPNGLVERQEQPEIQILLDALNEQIVREVQRKGFIQVMTIRVRGVAAIKMSLCKSRTLARDIEAFDAIARLARVLNKKLSAGYETTPVMKESYV